MAKVKIWHIILVFIAVLVALSFRFDSDYLVTRQYSLQRRIFSPAVNVMIYSYCGQRKQGCYILTDYKILKYLPGFEERTLLVDASNDEDFLDKINNPEITTLLVGNLSQDARNYLEIMIDAGRYKVINEVGGWNLIEIK